MAYQPTCPPVGPVVAPTEVVYRDFFHPQLVQVVHPIEIVNRHHCVPVPQHVVTCVERNEMVGVCSVKGKKNRSKNKRR